MQKKNPTKEKTGGNFSIRVDVEPLGVGQCFWTQKTILPVT